MPPASQLAGDQPQPPSAADSELVEDVVHHGLTQLPSRFVVPAYCRPAVALSPSPIQIPVIDLSGLHGTGRAQILAQIHSACSFSGFFQVINHGVSQETMEDLRSRILEFLNLPTEEKRSPDIIQGEDGQGFGSGFVNPQIGATEWRDYLLLQTFPETLRKYSKWPPLLREQIAAFSVQMKTLAQRLLAVFSENLQLPQSYIEDAMGVLHQKVLISHYPPCPQPDLAVGACEHTDVGVITCLWQTSEDVVGLQVRKDGQWHPVEPVKGALVINVGDQVEILSNGLYKSGQHRVVLNTTKARISVAAFHNPASNTVVSPAPNLIDREHPPLYEPTIFKLYAAKYGLEIE